MQHPGRHPVNPNDEKSPRGWRPSRAKEPARLAAVAGGGIGMAILESQLLEINEPLAAFLKKVAENIRIDMRLAHLWREGNL
jgi:hypothetical protein